MKEIIVKKDLVDAGFNIIAERYQRISQYGNMGAQLLHKNNAVVYVKDTGDFKTEYLLDKVEREAALKAQISLWMMRRGNGPIMKMMPN